MPCEGLRRCGQALRGHFQPPKALPRHIPQQRRVKVPLERAWLPARRPIPGHSLAVAGSSCRLILRLQVLKAGGRGLSDLARGLFSRKVIEDASQGSGVEAAARGHFAPVWAVPKLNPRRIRVKVPHGRPGLSVRGYPHSAAGAARSAENGAHWRNERNDVSCFTKRNGHRR